MERNALITLPFRIFIWIYRYTLSYFLGGRCRFEPTCSTYADEALRKHGLVKGSWLALRRLSRCHPWGPHGHDPVPPPH